MRSSRAKTLHFIASAVVPLVTAGPVVGTVDADALSAFVERGMDLWRVPGMSVAVVTGDEVLFRKGFGTTAVELTKPNWMTYGLAWFQQDFQGRKIDSHTGRLSGLIAIIGLDRAGDKAVIVLGNRDHAEMRHAVLWEVMDASDADPGRDWNQEIFDLYQGLAEDPEDESDDSAKL